MKKPRKNSLTDKILGYLARKLIDKSGELLDLTAMLMFDRGKLAPALYKDYNTPIYKIMPNLKKSSYFTVEGDNFYLSHKGRLEIIKRMIEQKKSKHWDGKWRAVIFDVPEKKRHQRNFLRWELKRLEFKELQHSVWITPYDIERELLALLKLWQNDFRGDIRFLTIEKITHDADFRKIFKV